MANIKPLEQASDKWSRRASAAAPDYAAGIENPRRSWAEASLAAENNYKQGVIAAANAGRYGQGVRSAGNEKWQNRAKTVGPGRFSEGVQVARSDWERGFRPYHQAIQSLKLPPRGPKGSPQNIQRVAAIATTLRQVFEKKGK